MKRLTTVVSLLLAICLLFAGCGIDQIETPSSNSSHISSDISTEQTDSSTTTSQTPESENSTSNTQKPTVPNKADTIQL